MSPPSLPAGLWSIIKAKSKLYTPNVISFWYLEKLDSTQGGRGHLPVYYTSPQSFIITFLLFVGVTTLVTFNEF